MRESKETFEEKNVLVEDMDSNIFFGKCERIFSDGGCKISSVIGIDHSDTIVTALKISEYGLDALSDCAIRSIYSVTNPIELRDVKKILLCTKRAEDTILNSNISHPSNPSDEPKEYKISYVPNHGIGQEVEFVLDGNIPICAFVKGITFYKDEVKYHLETKENRELIDNVDSSLIVRGYNNFI